MNANSNNTTATGNPPANHSIEKLNQDTGIAFDKIKMARTLLWEARGLVLDVACNNKLNHKKHARVLKLHKQLMALDDKLQKNAAFILCCWGAK